VGQGKDKKVPWGDRSAFGHKAGRPFPKRRRVGKGEARKSGLTSARTSASHAQEERGQRKSTTKRGDRKATEKTQGRKIYGVASYIIFI